MKTLTSISIFAMLLSIGGVAQAQNDWDNRGQPPTGDNWQRDPQGGTQPVGQTNEWQTTGQQGQPQPGQTYQQPPAAQPGAQPVADPVDPNAGFLPIPRAQRPLTLSAMTLRIDAQLNISRISFCVPNPITGGETCAGDTSVGMAAGAGFGITDDIEVGATVLPLVFSPDFDYGNPTVYGIFRFLSGDVEVGAQLSLVVPVQTNSSFVINPGLPVRFHFGDALAFDTGVFVPINIPTASGADPSLGLNVPLALTINATPNIFFGPRTAFNIVNFDGAGDNIVFPLGVFGGYTVASGASPIVDIYAGFDFPLFLNTFGGDAVTTNLWTIGVGANIYLNFDSGGAAPAPAPAAGGV